ncbi:DUF6371 domain-containing protein [Polaribacter sp. Z014]|uniref:DUF6371 domain-containing protein n=1 Tax=Polaribacter sp. Z014 TaxID=2927126 RepID=UPI002020C1B0|nr:DUF6371 domain-containing protein [Polaribacter sp. Z014]MCL7763402.1 DUF6371 domain-containing protein [Polaribacter sp. Z014]
MYHKIEQYLVFNKKRNKNIVTPCCHKSNKNLKFVTYKGYPDNYGYCHSCGKATLPPTIYKDEFGNEFYWNVINKKFNSVLHLYDNSVLQNIKSIAKNDSDCITPKKYIDFLKVHESMERLPENNLLVHLRALYGNIKVDNVKNRYYIGSTEDGGTVFWNVNKDNKVQKSKIFYHQKNGKRTTRFKVPFVKDDGYHDCLFGEHLLFKNDYPVILVEGEKTAIVCAIHFPNFNWLSYGGINGLTDDKMKVLSGEKVLIVPDLSEQAVSIAHKRIEELKTLDISAKIWDMRKGLSDEELTEKGFYNCDLEDFLQGNK